MFTKCVAGKKKFTELSIISVTVVRLLSRKVFFIRANNALLLAFVLLELGVFGIFLAKRLSVYTKPTTLRHMLAAFIVKYMFVCVSGILCNEMTQTMKRAGNFYSRFIDQINSHDSSFIHEYAHVIHNCSAWHFTPYSLEIVVLRTVLLTLEKFGNTKLFFFKSVLLKIIPVLGWAGKMFKFALFPVCIPIPLNEIFWEIVFWVKIDTTYLYKKLVLVSTQEILQENTINY